MKILLVFAHPERQSFNGAMFQTALETLTAAGHEVTTSDLYSTQFDPVSGRHNFLTLKNPDYFKQQIEEMHASETFGFAEDLEREMNKLEWCELMIWQFPLWWFGLPGILKGWVDRVFAMGRIYGGGRIYGDGIFKGRRAMLSLTTGGPAQAYVKDGLHGDIHAMLRPIHRGMLQFVGFDVLAPHIVYGPVRLDQTQRSELLGAYADRLKHIASEAPFDIGNY